MNETCKSYLDALFWGHSLEIKYFSPAHTKKNGLSHWIPAECAECSSKTIAAVGGYHCIVCDTFGPVEGLCRNCAGIPVPTAVYRAYNRYGELLYVGISHHSLRRFGEHSQDKPWWTEVDTVKITHYDSRTEALTAERQAIADERPQYNVQHNR
jgi:predicted GIY-YIG superfamily endonuclease